MDKIIMIKIEEFSTCCRCCLSNNVKTQPLFGASLGEMLQSIVPLEVKETDQFPQQICTRCVIKLSTSFNFCQTVRTSYHTLKEILEKSMEQLNRHSPVNNNNSDCNVLEVVNKMIPHNEYNTKLDNLLNKFDDNRTDVEITSTTYENVVNEKLFNCSHCTKQFHNKSEMEIHLRRDHKDPCSVCGKLISVLGMPRHLQCHSKIKSYVCQICGRPFADPSNLSKHMKTHTGELRNANHRGHLCSFCGKLFRWHTSLCRHRRIHTKTNLLICIVCFKQFGDQYSLKTHMASHTKIKSYKCDICDRAFTQLCNLKKHKKIHTDERPHKCPHCNRGFRQKCVMVLHTRKHTGDKPYTCQQCQKCFTWKNSLLVHMRIHNRVTKSSIKNNDVEENNDLKQLLNIIFLCMQCNEKFSSHELYEAHLKVHENEPNFVATH